MSENCLCGDDRVVILPCSGGSNCGQIANAAAVELTKEGVGSIYCLAGIGAHISGMVESTRSADRVLVIDGCPVACGKKTVEHAGLTVTDYVDVMSEGIEKNHDFDFAPELVSRIIDRAKSLLSEPRLVASATE